MHFDGLLKLTRFLLFICINAHCLKLSCAKLLKAAFTQRLPEQSLREVVLAI